MNQNVVQNLLGLCGLPICVIAMLCAALAGCANNTNPATTPSQEWRIIAFAGYEWRVKTSNQTLAGPGPNYFSDSTDNVWVDSAGNLHLKITHRAGRWYCPEVVSVNSFGYGTYRFTLVGNVDQLNEHVVLGLFTWDDDLADAHREIDVELARWSDPANQNAQFVVQPYSNSGNMYRFDVQLHGADSMYSFTWTLKQIMFQAAYAHGERIAAWEYTGPDIPQPGREQARINVWLFQGQPPSDGQEVEVIVKKFEFIPSTTPKLH